MDLSVPHFAGYHGHQSDGTDIAVGASYPTFAIPTPVNMSKSHMANSLTPGVIPSPLNFPSITPPSSPYSFYGLYSPSSLTNSVSPLYDPTYLKRLKSNPMFRDLQSLLLQECMQMKVPANLITTSWNLMQLHKDTPASSSTTNQNSSSSQAPPTGNNSTNQNAAPAQGSGQKVYMQHMKLQDKLLKVRIDPAISADGLSVENDYSKEVGNIEMDRYRALNSCPQDEVKDTINSYFDKQRLKLLDETEEMLDKLIVKAESMRKAAMETNTNIENQNQSRPVYRETERSQTSHQTHQRETTHQPRETIHHQPVHRVAITKETTQGASLLLQPAESKDKLNAVRKLKFNMNEDTMSEKIETAAQVDDDDYLNCSVNSEDFEIDEIDVETVTVEKESHAGPVDGKVDPGNTTSHETTHPLPSQNSCSISQVNTQVPLSPAIPYMNSGSRNSVGQATNSDRAPRLAFDTDILQRCIEESGLKSVAGHQLVPSEHAFNDYVAARDSVIGHSSVTDMHGHTSIASSDDVVPDSTSSSASDSPISMASAGDLTNQNLSTDGSTGTSNSSFNREEERNFSRLHSEEPKNRNGLHDDRQGFQNGLFPPKMNLKFNEQMFSTPVHPNSALKFTNPDTLSMALAEMQKLCGGPSVNFTPELRKDFMASHLYGTPQSIRDPSSPLNEISNTYTATRLGSLATGLDYSNYTKRPSSATTTTATTTGSSLHHHQQTASINDNVTGHLTRLSHIQDDDDSIRHSSRHTHQQQQRHHGEQRSYHQHHEPHHRQQQVTADSINNNVQLNSNTTASAIRNTNNSADMNTVTTSGSSETCGSSGLSTKSNADTLTFENMPVFRTHRMLTPDATEILNRWYNDNVQYPYPNDEQVNQLSELTGITARQVKKWMANKRVRCFNTLSITGNQHPIKYKYQGQGRKRKAAPSTIEKENCDSTTEAKKPNYSMLTDEAKTILNNWYEENIYNPYPSEEDKEMLATRCRISVGQVKSWFANKRNRSNNTKRQVPNYFIHKFPEYSHLVHMVGQKREEERMLKRRKVNEYMYIQPPFFL